MPCTSPSINQSEVDGAYDEIMQLLLEKYGIQKYHPRWQCGKNIDKSRDEVNSKFRLALEELFLRQACEDF